MRPDYTEHWEQTLVPSPLKTIHFLHFLCSPGNPATFTWGSPNLAASIVAGSLVEFISPVLAHSVYCTHAEPFVYWSPAPSAALGGREVLTGLSEQKGSEGSHRQSQNLLHT